MPKHSQFMRARKTRRASANHRDLLACWRTLPIKLLVDGKGRICCVALQTANLDRAALRCFLDASALTQVFGGANTGAHRPHDV